MTGICLFLLLKPCRGTKVSQRYGWYLIYAALQ